MPVLLSVETGGRVLLMGDQGPHDGKAQVRVLAPSGSSRIELLVDGCRTTTVNQDAPGCGEHPHHLVSGPAFCLRY